MLMSDSTTRSADNPDLLRAVDTCLLPGFDGTSVPDWLRRRLAGGLGGVVFYAGNVSDLEQLSQVVDVIRKENPAALVAIDEEGGDVTRLESASGSSWPGNLALGAVDDPGLTRTVAAQIGADLAAAGVNLNLAPVADINSNPQNPVIGVRSFGGDPERVSVHTAAYVEGLQGAGVAACVKHFPGHGDTGVDSHLDLPVVEGDLAPALEPFRAATRADTVAMMTGHLRVPAYGPEPATVNPSLIAGVLRRGLGFDGAVITDALDMQAIDGGVGMAEGGVLSLAAGADALCLGPAQGDSRTEAVRSALIAAVQSGRLTEQRLKEAAQRLRRVAAWATPRAGESGEWNVGLAAARRAVRARNLSGLMSAPYVVQLAPEPTIAVGDTPWGLGAVLAESLPGTENVRLGEAPEDVEGMLARAGDRPLILVVRDPHRYAWALETAERILAHRPDAVLVDMGYPSGLAERADSSMVTHGAARVCAYAAAERLLG